jgi:hypothetical protein
MSLSWGDDAIAENVLPRAARGAAGITVPGAYPITMEEYHLDPCQEPSLSCSVAKALVRRSPLHAWQMHPRFGSVGITPTSVMDDGSAVHAMMLGQTHLIETVKVCYGPKTKRKELIGAPVRDYQTDAAKDERDEIRAAGKIPVLQHRLTELQRCRAAATQQIQGADDGPGFFAPGRSEITLISREDDIYLRCLVDRLPDDGKFPPYDLKCTELSAAPGGWERRLQLEYAFQDAFYRRVIRGALGVTAEPMRFIVIELEPPHGTAVMAAAPSLQEIAEAEVERAIQRWRKCMRSGAWPCYAPHTAWIEATGWQIQQSDDAAIRETVANRYDPHSLEGHPFPFV